MMNKGRGSDLANRTKRFALEEGKIAVDVASLKLLMKEADELTAILVASVRTAKRNR